MTDKKILPIWTEEINGHIDTVVERELERLYKMYDIKRGDIHPAQLETWNNCIAGLTEIFQQLITQNFDGEVKVLGEGETDTCKHCGINDVDADDNYVVGIGKVCVNCWYDLPT
jgi:hypothetical protein